MERIDVLTTYSCPKLNVDRGCSSEMIIEKRSHSRTGEEDVCELFDISKILVRISTDKSAIAGNLYDIGEGGIAVCMPTKFAVDSIIRVTFLLGRKVITSRAMVRHFTKIGDQYVAGIVFIGLESEYAEYINGNVCIITILNKIDRSVGSKSIDLFINQKQY